MSHVRSEERPRILNPFLQVFLPDSCYCFRWLDHEILCLVAVEDFHHGTRHVSRGLPSFLGDSFTIMSEIMLQCTIVQTSRF